MTLERRQAFVLINILLSVENQLQLVFLILALLARLECTLLDLPQGAEGISIDNREKQNL
jgi:hypothetical protein